MAITIDLEKPGRFVATAEHAKDYTFYLVTNKPNFTAEAFEKNPNVASGQDLFFRSPMISDQHGSAAVDLAPKAKEIKDKLKAAKTDAKLVVLGTMRNYPDRRKAFVEPYTLAKLANSIKLTGLRTSVDAHQWVAYHHAIIFIQMVVKGSIREVVCEINPKRQPIPMFASWVQAGPSWACKQIVLGAVGEPHAPSRECIHPPHLHRGGWWSSVPNWSAGVIKMPITPGVENYVIGIYPRFSGQWTVTVKGTGEAASLQDQVTIRMNGRHPHPGD